jgi:2-polyprenyl-6-methoxyphenol hydroxylase-like FAD-dependent oxidoreductase
VDSLDCRGLLERFHARAAVAIPNAAHFALIPLDLGKLGDLGLRGVFIQQAATEEILRDYARELGVEVRTGCELIALQQDTSGVNVQVSGPDGHGQLRARFVVGCDGGASVVRKQAGIDFPGIPPTFLLRLGDVTLEGELTPDDLPDVRVPLIPLGSGFYRVITTEPYPAGLDRDAPMTLDELRASIRRVNGRDLPISGTRWVSRFTDSSRQAARYRNGRVLLAGDAAHVHLPAGGPGLNTDLQDAVNLGWKLAAEVQGVGTSRAPRHLPHRTAR